MNMKTDLYRLLIMVLAFGFIALAGLIACYGFWQASELVKAGFDPIML